MNPSHNIALIIISTILCCFSCNPEESDTSSSWSKADKAYLVTELRRSTSDILHICSDISDQLWDKKTSSGWSIGDVVEHLIVQNELHFREIRAMSVTPPSNEFNMFTSGRDSLFIAYATDPTASEAQWFLEPIGRFCSKKASLEAYERVRTHFTNHIEKTEVDFRKHYTFRRQISGLPEEDVRAGDVRDIHQLVLTGIAHGDRHSAQISRMINELRVTSSQL